jgi:ADP-ribose pyrophosphatase YjhB (NUDIX family)
MPGGLQQDESFDECLRREFEDEVGATLSSVGEIEFFWRDYTDDGRGYRLRLAAKATLASTQLKPRGDDGEVLVETRFVSRDEFLALPIQESEKGVLSQVNRIWPS